VRHPSRRPPEGRPVTVGHGGRWGHSPRTPRGETRPRTPAAAGASSLEWSTVVMTPPPASARPTPEGDGRGIVARHRAPPKGRRGAVSSSLSVALALTSRRTHAPRWPRRTGVGWSDVLRHVAAHPRASRSRSPETHPTGSRSPATEVIKPLSTPSRNPTATRTWRPSPDEPVPATTSNPPRGTDLSSWRRHPLEQPPPVCHARCGSTRRSSPRPPGPPALVRAPGVPRRGRLNTAMTPMLSIGRPPDRPPKGSACVLVDPRKGRRGDDPKVVRRPPEDETPPMSTRRPKRVDVDGHRSTDSMTAAIESSGQRGIGFNPGAQWFRARNRRPTSRTSPLGVRSICHPEEWPRSRIRPSELLPPKPAVPPLGGRALLPLPVATPPKGGRTGSTSEPCSG
jgi:hypothetical protein